MGVKLAAASGGSIELVPTNTASAFTVTVPAATGNVVLTNVNSNLDINAAGANYLTLSTNSTERARIDSSGNLGLGVTPSAWQAASKAYEIGASGTSQGAWSITASGYMDIARNAYTATGGTSTYKFTSYATMYRQDPTGQHIWYNAPSGTAGNAITFTQAMTLDASGRLLVGCTATDSGAQFRFQYGTGQNGLQLFDNSGASGSTFAIFGINSGGNSNIGSISRVGATSAVVYNTTSDYRLKTVTGVVNGQGERIDALKPVDYQWKDGNTQGRGFLAHEFQEVYPNSVTGTKDAVDVDGKPVYQAMQPSTPEVIADLVAEIQSLRKRLATLESK